jgi:hypothetical protein
MNLEAVVDRREEVQAKLIESRQGFVCYLLIIDRRSRYVWAFPLKSKSVQPTLIDKFLEIHGLHSAPLGDERYIRSDGEGSLAVSNQFRQTVARRGYVVQSTATDTSSQNGLAERPHRTLGSMVPMSTVFGWTQHILLGRRPCICSIYIRKANICLCVLLNINVLLNQGEAGWCACILTRWPCLLPFQITDCGSKGCSTTSTHVESH